MPDSSFRKDRLMLAIYMNSREWGGVDVLAARFAEHLRERELPFLFIDGEDSRLRQEASWAPFLTPEQAAQGQAQADAIFFPSIAKLRDPCIPWSIAKNNARSFAWIVHPNDVSFHMMPLARRLVGRFGPNAYKLARLARPQHFRLVRNTLAEMIDRGSVAVMDGATKRSLNHYYGLNAEPLQIPIPAPLGAASTVSRQPGGARLTFGYLGRLDAFKWSALRPFVETGLAGLARHRDISLLAITDGPFAQDLRTLCKQHKIELEITGFLPNNQARTCIRQRVDIGVAMGTAALDIAAESRPCIVIDPAFDVRGEAQRLYRFIHETDDFTLGEYRDFAAYRETGRSLETLVSESLADPDASRKSREYVATRHDPETIFENLLGRIENSELPASGLRNMADRINQSFRKSASLFGLRSRRP